MYKTIMIKSHRFCIKYTTGLRKLEKETFRLQKLNPNPLKLPVRADDTDKAIRRMKMRKPPGVPL